MGEEGRKRGWQRVLKPTIGNYSAKKVRANLTKRLIRARLYWRESSICAGSMLRVGCGEQLGRGWLIRGDPLSSDRDLFTRRIGDQLENNRFICSIIITVLHDTIPDSIAYLRRGRPRRRLEMPSI